MISLAALLALAPLAGLLPLGGLQDPVPPPLEPPREAPAADRAAERASSLQPGVLPADASPQAVALWRALVRATRAPEQAPEPVRAFDLTFDVRVRRDTQRNDGKDLRFRYLAPGFVRATLESGREHVRGPAGDFLIDGATAKALAPTRENQEDRRQIDEELAIARNFVALSDPAHLRIASLALLDAPPAGLPPALAERAGALDWLAVASPDFRLFQSDDELAAPALYLARLGLEKQTGKLVLAQLGRDLRRPDERALLVALEGTRPLDGWLLPRLVFVRAWDVERRAFEERPSLELALKHGSLRAPLAPDDFRP